MIECAEDVVELGLDHVDRRVVAEAGVGAVDDEQVREAADDRRCVRGHASGPVPGQQFVADTADDAGVRLLRRMETGGEDHGIDLVLRAVGGDEGVAVHSFERRRFDRHRWAGERRVVLVRDEHPLAADLVVRCEFRAQLRVGHLGREVVERAPARSLDRRGHTRALGVGLLGGPEQRRPETGQPLGVLLEQRLLGLGVVVLFAGDDVGRAPLQDHQFARDLCDPRHDLDGRGPRPDHRDAFAAQFGVVIPAGRMEQRTPEGVEPRDVGDAWFGQPAAGENEGPGRELAAARVKRPARTRLVPGHGVDIRAEPQVIAEPLLVRTGDEVVADLRAVREEGRPPRVRQERPGVEVRGHVAGDPGVRVVTPGAADSVRPLEDQERGHALALQPDAEAESREPRADDRDIELGHARATRFRSSVGSP